MPKGDAELKLIGNRWRIVQAGTRLPLKAKRKDGTLGNDKDGGGWLNTPAMTEKAKRAFSHYSGE